MATTPRPRVLIADDHLLLAQTLERALALSLGLSSSDVAHLSLPETPATADWLVAAVLALRPAVLLLDLDLGVHGDGLPLIEPITGAGGEVVAIPETEEPDLSARALRAGAAAVVPKVRPLADLAGAVRHLLAGEPAVSPAERRRVLEQQTRLRKGAEEVWARFDRLSMREAALLGQLMVGRLVRAPNGDRGETALIAQLLDTLEVGSVAQAVELATGIGWTAPRDPSHDGPVTS